MPHITKFEEMNSTQRSLHNLTFIIDQDDEIKTYKQSISNAIDEISLLQLRLKEAIDKNEALMKGEYICLKCGLRKPDDYPKPDF